VNAHSAEADIFATLEVFESQLERYPELNKDVDFLHKFCSMNNNVDLAGRIVMNDKKQECFNFGKHKGKTVEEVFAKEPSYYDWMMQGDFPAETKQVITALRLRKFNGA
jgi:DNA polymerase-3 subunit epsilon